MGKGLIKRPDGTMPGRVVGLFVAVDVLAGIVDSKIGPLRLPVAAVLGLLPQVRRPFPNVFVLAGLNRLAAVCLPQKHVEQIAGVDMIGGNRNVEAIPKPRF